MTRSEFLKDRIANAQQHLAQENRLYPNGRMSHDAGGSMTKTQFLLMAAQRGLDTALICAQACSVCLAQRQLWANAVRQIEAYATFPTGNLRMPANAKVWGYSS